MSSIIKVQHYGIKVKNRMTVVQLVMTLSVEICIYKYTKSGYSPVADLCKIVVYIQLIDGKTINILPVVLTVC